MSGAIFVNNVSNFSGGIVNAANGLISAQTSGIGAVGVSTFAGGIANKGTIFGGYNRHLCLRRFHVSRRHQQQRQDHCDRHGDGIIVSSVAVFGDASAGGGITNTGTISAPGATGIGIVGVSLFQGAVTNAGTVFASKRGIDVNNVVVFGTTKFGGVTNSGKISASHTGVFAGGQLTSGAAETLQIFSGAIRNNGTISAGVGRGIFLGGIATGSDTLVTLATLAGGITNTGRIVAGNGALGIEVGGFASGGNVNQASVMVGTIAGGVRNAGTISAGDAILVGGQTATRGAVTISLFSGGVGNTGVISATEDGIVVGAKHAASLNVISTFSGGISNGGTISAGSTGILTVNVVTFASGIKNTGKIVAGNSAIAVAGISTFGGGVTNNGQISAGFGIEVTNVVQFGNTASAGGGIANTGTIAAKSTGILLIRNVSTFAGAINNSGKISAGGRGINVQSVALFGNTDAAGGGITNTGTIAAALTGVVASFDTNFLGGIANKGTISAGAPSQAAIFVFEVSSFSGGIVNSTGGVISAVNAGVGALGDSIFFGGIVNKGTYYRERRSCHRSSRSNHLLRRHQQSGRDQRTPWDGRWRLRRSQLCWRRYQRRCRHCGRYRRYFCIGWFRFFWRRNQ